MNLYSFCNEITPEYVKEVTSNYKDTMVEIIDNGGYPSSDES